MHHHLLAFIDSLPNDPVVILHGNLEVARSWDTYFPFRQSSSFLYITGLSIPDLSLTIVGDVVILWRNPITPKDILWGHDKLSDEELQSVSGIAQIRDRCELDAYVSQQEEHPTKDTYTKSIHSLRMIKDPEEIEAITYAARVTQEAFEYVRTLIKPGMYEYEIEAEFARIFRRHHLTEAYPTIVASGPNACILHYTSHTRKIEAGDFVLIDAGAEYMGYASDITRTLMVWEYSLRKQQVYDAVGRIKTIAENTVKPGITLTEYEAIVRKTMNTELQWLGLIPLGITDEDSEILSKKYYPHRTSHFLGLDVHDVGPREIELISGMVITIEPGIYIKEEGIGVRIEDDYLVTESGCTRLS